MKGGGPAAFAMAVFLVVAAFSVAAFWSQPPAQVVTSESATTTSAEIQGIVTGYVTVGPSQPACQAGQSCDENMSGYSLVFSQCVGSSGCLDMTAAIAPSGHYSILLSTGNYTVTGLTPSCEWPGCASAFPKTVAVQGGMQIVVDFEIDTGIR